MSTSFLGKQAPGDQQQPFGE